MKPPQFIAATVLSVIVLILSIVLVVTGNTNSKLQTQLQAQQEDINKGSMSQQVGVNILKAIAQGSVKDDKLKEVLTKSGYTVNTGSNAAPVNP